MLSPPSPSNNENLHLKSNKDDQWDNGEENIHDDIEEKAIAFTNLLKTRQATAL